MIFIKDPRPIVIYKFYITKYNSQKRSQDSKIFNKIIIRLITQYIIKIYFLTYSFLKGCKRNKCIS